MGITRTARAGSATQDRAVRRFPQTLSFAITLPPQLRVAFHNQDEHGNYIRQGHTEVAAALGLPLDRAERLLRVAMKSVPLVADSQPVEVIYEDEALLAVNKPPGLCTAPRHRFEVSLCFAEQRVGP